ncbi:MAG: DEAD/DEAH box helicase [Prevotella sp.]|nr:DEAD/DEAH box helicase [Prevotella sp.]
MLDPKVQQWVWKQGWTSLKEIQENAIPPIITGDCDAIISAATAGGKTEAVFLPVLTNILRCNRSVGYQVLYISPLKSLINDQYRRLLDMTEGMPINVTPWHGDVSSYTKKKSLENPNGILVITPESLESLLMHHHHEIIDAFGNLMYIIVDELHAFIPTERGKQLQSLMSRIEHITRRRIPRIAMSATFSNYEMVKLFLRQDQSLKCVIPQQGEASNEVKVLIKEFTYGQGEKEIAASIIADEIYTKLRGSNNLIFTNSRQDCELFMALLNEKCKQENVINEFRIHHGSISKEIRTNTEHELQLGEKPITAICTATLELGVDIGKVKSIAQIEVSNSVSGLRQRLGRSGRRGEPSVLRIFSTDRIDNSRLLDTLKSNLIQNVAVIELLKEHKYENYSIDGVHLSTLIQQILSLIAEYGSFYPKEGWNLLCKNGAFCNVSANLFLMLLKDLKNNDVIQQNENGQIFLRFAGEEIIADREFYASFKTEPEFDLVNMQNGEHIGSVLASIGIGYCIVFGGKRWLVEEIDYKNSKVLVSPSEDGKIPIFRSEYSDIDSIIPQKMKEIYLSDEIYPYLDTKSEAIKCIQEARYYFRKNKFDCTFGKYDQKELFITWAGSKVNRTISLLLKLFLDKSVLHDYIFVYDTTKQDIQEILKHAKPKAEELCSYLMRFVKETKKYDFLLSEELLNIQYASMYLDVDKAWEVMHNA